MAGSGMPSRASSGPYSNSSSDYSQVSPALTGPEMQQQQQIFQALQQQQRNAKQAMMGDETIFHFPGQSKGKNCLFIILLLKTLINYVSCHC